MCVWGGGGGGEVRGQNLNSFVAVLFVSYGSFYCSFESMGGLNVTDARWSEWLLAMRHKNCMVQCAQPVANVTNFKWSMTNFFTGLYSKSVRNSRYEPREKHQSPGSF